MKKIVEFIQQYLEEEYRTVVAQYMERNQDKFEQQRAKLAVFAIPKVTDEVYRSSNPDEEFFELGEKRVKAGRIAKRPLFQIKLYKHPEFDELYRVYLGPDQVYPKDPTYDLNLFVTEIGGQLKIVSRYKFNRFSERQRPNYISDNGLMWNYHSGKKIETLGTLLETHKFKAPDDRHGALAEYTAE